MLVITTKSPYAVRALCELALRAEEGPVPIAEIARARDIPVQFLEGLFSILRRGGILQSQRGVKGGYQLARAPEEINILEVVELLEGEIGQGASEHGPLWEDVVRAVKDVLAGHTLRDVVEREAQQAGATMYWI